MDSGSMIGGSNPSLPAKHCIKGDRSAFDLSPNKQKTGTTTGFHILVLAAYELHVV